MTEIVQQPAPRFSVTRFVRYMLIAWVVASTVLGRSFTALTHDPWDSQLFAYFGLEWLRGRIPYVQFWDNKPPGIFAVDAIVFSAFPRSFTALAVVEGIVILGCIATIYLLLRRLGAPERVAWLGAIAAAVAANHRDYNQLGNLTEIYVLWPATLSVFFFTKAAPKFQRRWVFVAGLFAGVAAIFKPVGLSPLLAEVAFLLYLVLASRGMTLRKAAALTAACAAGAVAAWLPFGFYFCWHGALKEMLYAALVYPVMYGAHAQKHFFTELVILTKTLSPLASLVAAAAVGPVLLCVASREARDGRSSRDENPLCYFWPLALVWLLFDLAGVVAGGKNFYHYFLCLAPSLAVAAAFSYWFLTDQIPARASSRAVLNTLFLLIVFPLGVAQRADAIQMWGWLVHNRPVDASQPLVDRLDIASRYLNRVRQAGDTLFLWDFLPQIYFQTGMDSPVRLVCAHHLNEFPRAINRYGPEILNQLQEAPPSFIVDATLHPNALAQSNWVYQRFRDFLNDHYEMVQVIPNSHPEENEGEGDIRIYRGRGRAPNPSAESRSPGAN